MDSVIMGAAYVGAFLFILGHYTVFAAAGYMSRIGERRFPLEWCVLAARLPAAVTFRMLWLFGRDRPGVLGTFGVLGILWLAGVMSVYAGGWLARFRAGVEGDADRGRTSRCT